MHDGAQIPLALLIVFVSAKLLGELFERFRQPAIVGAILAGVLVGPHGLRLVPESEAITVLAELGVMFLLFRVGLEVKSSELLAVGGRALIIALAGVVIPFLAGWGVSAAWDLPVLESVFIGAAMVATSVGITAQVLASGGWLAERASKLILAAAVIDDVLGLLVLAAVSSMARGPVNYTDLAFTVAFAGGFTILTVLVGSRVMQRVLPKLVSGMRVAEAEFTLALSTLFALSLLATYAGVAAIIGAFLAGMALSETVDQRVHHLTEGVTELLVPFFLAGIGMNMDLGFLRDGPAMIFAGIVVVLAVMTKMVGCGLAALPLGRTDAIRIGVGMIPRGEVGMVVAQIGLGFGVMEQSVYSTIVFMSIATTMIAPPMLRAAYRSAASVPSEEPMRIG